MHLSEKQDAFKSEKREGGVQGNAGFREESTLTAWGTGEGTELGLGVFRGWVGRGGCRGSHHWLREQRHVQKKGGTRKPGRCSASGGDSSGAHETAEEGLKVGFKRKKLPSVEGPPLGRHWAPFLMTMMSCISKRPPRW